MVSLGDISKLTHEIYCYLRVVYDSVFCFNDVLLVFSRVEIKIEFVHSKFLFRTLHSIVHSFRLSVYSPHFVDEKKFGNLELQLKIFITDFEYCLGFVCVE